MGPIDDCLLASERGNRARELVLAWCREQGLAAWERGRREHATATTRRSGLGAVPPDGRPQLRNVVVREGRRSAMLQVRLVTTDGELDVFPLAEALRDGLGEQLEGLLWTRSGSPAETTAGGDTELVCGEGELPEQLCGLELRISAEAFFQTNTEMAEVLYGVVSRVRRAGELASGCSTCTAASARSASRSRPGRASCGGSSCSSRPSPTRSRAPAATGSPTPTSSPATPGTALPELVQRAGRPDVVVVDPPRAGLSKKVVQRIIESAPKRIVYVSCNPTTLAPNAAEMVAAGWSLQQVRPVDMFPQTHHIESVALLERR